MIAMGLDERDGERLYDIAIFVDQTGNLLWKHRKINVMLELMVPPYTEGRVADIGVVETEFGRIGLLICADTFVDAHLERVLALNPELLLVPYGWAATAGEWPGHAQQLAALVKRRAIRLHCPVVGVNLVGAMSHGPWRGRTYGGSSVVADANGDLLVAVRDRDVDVRIVVL